MIVAVFGASSRTGRAFVQVAGEAGLLQRLHYPHRRTSRHRIRRRSWSGRSPTRRPCAKCCAAPMPR